MPYSTPIGRFAPSPTGALHLGSLTTAVASYCHIKSLGGQWLVRIEDTDTERCHHQNSTQILTDLTKLGLHWDKEVIYQSKRQPIYLDYLFDVLMPFCYACECSRKSLSAFFSKNLPTSSDISIYPRLCLNKHLEFHHHKVRLQLPDINMGFFDGIQSIQWQNPQKLLGDVVVQRQNGIINYILACSIDDGLQEITHVMRGLDILSMTMAQVYIMKIAQLPVVKHWYHLPLLHNHQGQKLSKQNMAPAIDTTNPSQLLAKAFELLRQPKVEIDTPERMLKQGIAQWDNQYLNNQYSLGII